MGLKSFRNSETEKKLTLPNAMSAVRLVGGLALGGLLWKQNIDPTVAFATTAVLGATDAEGNVISFFDKHPRLHGIRDALRIFPSVIGRKGDTVADKAFVMGVMAGGLAGGFIPGIDAVPILATEVAVAGVSLNAEAKGYEPQVSNVGKWSLVAKGLTIGTDLITNSFEGSAHEVLQNAGHMLAATAVVLGGLSCLDLVSQTHNAAQAETVQ